MLRFFSSLLEFLAQRHTASAALRLTKNEKTLLRPFPTSGK